MINTQYKEWSEKAESIETFEVGRDGIRDIYSLPNKTIVYHEQYVPRHWGKKSREQTVVEICVEDNKENSALAKKHGGRLWQTPYGQEGQMYFVFDGTEQEEDSLKLAFEFVMKERDNILVAEYESVI